MHSIATTVKEIGKHVQEHHRMASFSKQRLAELVGKRRAYIIGVENGSLNDIPLLFVYELADIFKCDVTDFLSVRRVIVEIPNCLGEGFLAAAQMLRADFSLSVPLDMEAVLKRAGILMISLSLGEDIATVLDTQSFVSVVFLDSTIVADRSKKRAALAHALGHYIAEYGFKGIYIDKKERLVLSESRISMQDEISERKARAFATALLLPQDVFQERLSDAAKKSGGNDDKAVAGLAAFFGVGVVAALALMHSGDGKK